MVISNKELMANARSQLKGKWGSVIIVSILYVLLIGIPGSLPKIGGIINLILGGPLAFGFSYYFLSFTRNSDPKFEDLFKGFSDFSRTIVAYLLMIVFIILWLLLLIVPGIIAAISYSMTFYILVDNPDMSAQEAIKRSKELMTGNKKRFFYLFGRFTGWFILCIVTAGIGFIWLIPYVSVSTAHFYKSLLPDQLTDSH
jgi:uncharacterized membrane protein